MPVPATAMAAMPPSASAAIVLMKPSDNLNQRRGGYYSARLNARLLRSALRGKFMKPLDHTQQPQHQDQDQQSAKSDIHDTLPIFGSAEKPKRSGRRSFRCEAVTIHRFATGHDFYGYYFTRRESAGFA
jgi:hypothetical protein